MIAALPMYDMPWLRPAHDRFWARLAQDLRGRGVDAVPATLSHGGNMAEAWASPALFLGQTCGYPLVTSLDPSIQLVATPHYVADGCTGPYHRAAIVVRRDDPATSLADLRGARAGMNDAGSNSGANLFRAAIAPVANGARFFRSVTVTRSHARSLAAILSGRIDVAAIDAVTLALLRDRYPEHAGAVRVLEWTAPSPSLPLITAARSSQQRLQAIRLALSAVVDDPTSGSFLDPLRIAGFTTLSRDDYRPLQAIERDARALGYPTLN